MVTMRRKFRHIILITVVIIFFITNRVEVNKKLTLNSGSSGLTVKNQLGGISEAAIAVLVPNTDNDSNDFCYALKSLSNLPSDKENAVPILVFHEGNLSTGKMESFRKCTRRNIFFHIVNFKSSYPPGFDSEKEFQQSLEIGTIAINLGRGRWGYSQMIRFWTTTIWTHPAIQKFDTIMRIDTDSCFTNKGLRGLLSKEMPYLDDRFFYHSDGPWNGGDKYIEGLFDFAVGYMEKEDISPSYPKLWSMIKRRWEDMGVLPIFVTNLEIFRKSFFLRADVKKWHESLTEHEPYGVFRKRWGDAQTRVFTIAMFADERTVRLTMPDQGYIHGRGRCDEYFTKRGIFGNLLRSGNHFFK